jgi:hypothetical protein
MYICRERTYRAGPPTLEFVAAVWRALERRHQVTPQRAQSRRCQQPLHDAVPALVQRCHHSLARCLRSRKPARWLHTQGSSRCSGRRRCTRRARHTHPACRAAAAAADEMRGCVAQPPLVGPPERGRHSSAGRRHRCRPYVQYCVCRQTAAPATAAPAVDTANRALLHWLRLLAEQLAATRHARAPPKAANPTPSGGRDRTRRGVRPYAPHTARDRRPAVSTADFQLTFRLLQTSGFCCSCR